MNTIALLTLNPRKEPRQRRSVATVDAIFEAATQVLVTDGPVRLNTTRIAERAGVSVGTLYQYFPNKHALLFSVLERHLAMLSEALETIREANCDAPSDSIAAAVVAAYLKVRMSQTEVSPALYLVAMQLDATELIQKAMERSEQAIAAMLATCCDGRFADPLLIARTMTAVIYGTVPAFCDRVLSPAHGSEAQRQLSVMFSAYLAASRSSTLG